MQGANLIGPSQKKLLKRLDNIGSVCKKFASPALLQGVSRSGFQNKGYLQKDVHLLLEGQSPTEVCTSVVPVYRVQPGYIVLV